MKVPTGIIIIVLFLSPVLLSYNTGPAIVSTEDTTLSSLQSWLSGWEFRKSHTIESSLGAGNNYSVRLTVHYESGTDSGADVYCDTNCSTDFGDIRFVNNDGASYLDYWIESYVASDYAVYWVEITDNLNTDQDIYVYYGNSEATSISDGDATFLFFDDFNDDSLDTNKWYESYTGGSYAESGGTLVISSDATNWEAIGAKSKFGFDHAWSMRCFGSDDSADSVGWGVDDRSDDGTYVGTEISDAKFSYYTNKKYETRHEGAQQETSRTTGLTAYKHWSIHVHSGMTEFYEDDALGANHTMVLTDTVGHMFTTLFSKDITVDWAFTRNCIVTEPNHGRWGLVETETQTTTPTPTTPTNTNPVPTFDIGMMLEVGSVAVIIISGALICRSRKTTVHTQESYNW